MHSSLTWSFHQLRCDGWLTPSSLSAKDHKLDFGLGLKQYIIKHIIIESTNVLYSNYVCIVLHESHLLHFFHSVGFLFDLAVGRQMGRHEKHFSWKRPFLLRLHTQYRNPVPLLTQCLGHRPWIFCITKPLELRGSVVTECT
jgi:hypothetical protein